MNILISVIVPIYNASKYLRKCIESVEFQKYLNWQLILVDDGSKDDSLSICQEYAVKDDRILVFHQQNAGAGAARNKGIENATGEYVVFLDSDDIISEDYLYLLSKHSEDVVFIDIEDVDENGRSLNRKYMSQFKDYPIDDIIRAQMTGKLPWGGVRKAVKRNLIESNNIRYTSHKVGEEALYSFQVLDKAESVAFIPKLLYKYVQRDNSLSRSVTEDPWGNVALGLREFIKSEGDKQYAKYADTLNAFMIAACAASFQRLAMMYSYNGYLKKASERRSSLFKQIDNEYPIDWKHLGTKAKVAGFFAYKNFKSIVWLLNKLKKQ
jgi:glycosyltransferase involved in cell wall biosynthesis